jgi:hypothetical protein
MGHVDYQRQSLGYAEAFQNAGLGKPGDAAVGAFRGPGGRGSPGPLPARPGASWHVLGPLPTGPMGSPDCRRYTRLIWSTTRCACSAAGQGRAMARHLIGGDGALAASFPWRNRLVWPRRRAPARPAHEPALDQGLVPPRRGRLLITPMPQTLRRWLARRGD